MAEIIENENSNLTISNLAIWNEARQKASIVPWSVDCKYYIETKNIFAYKPSGLGDFSNGIYIRIRKSSDKNNTYVVTAGNYSNANYNRALLLGNDIKLTIILSDKIASCDSIKAAVTTTCLALHASDLAMACNAVINGPNHPEAMLHQYEPKEHINEPNCIDEE